MSEIFAYPWGILILLFLSYGIWRGRYQSYLASLKISGSWFLVLVLAVFLGSLFSPPMPLPGRRIYLNLGTILGLFLPAIYWLSLKPWQKIVRGWLAAAIIAFGLYFLHTEALIRIQRLLPLPNWATLSLSALIVVIVAGKRSNSYGALILGTILSHFIGAWRGIYGFWEVGGLALVNNILMVLILVEVMLVIKAWLSNIYQEKTPAGSLTNHPG